MKKQTVFLVQCCALFACSGSDAPGEDRCVEDFQCDVGFVCQTGEGDGEGTCMAAAPGDERTFGAEHLDFTTGDEAYLVAVLTLPEGPSAADSLVSFDLTAGVRSSSGALRLRRGTSPPQDLDENWNGQLEWDRQRHQFVTELVRDVQANKRQLRAAAGRSTCGPCGDSQLCWGGTCTDEAEVVFPDGSTVNTTLVGVVDPTGLPINVLLDQNDISVAAQQAALQAAEAFHETLSLQHELLGVSGHVGPMDRDQDGRLTVVFTNKTTASIPSSIVGFFEPRDFLPPNQGGATGNQADILWSRVPGSGSGAQEITESLAVGTLAHEYTHLVSFAQRVYGRPDSPLQETLWLDEGLAHLMEDLTGWGPSNISSVQAALAQWPDSTLARDDQDLPSQRGQAYLLLRHMIDQRALSGGANNAQAVATKDAAAQVVSALIEGNAAGFEHKIFADAGPDGYWQWLRAVYTSGNDEVTQSGAKAAGYLPVATAPTGNTIGIQPFGEFEDARGNAAYLDGPRFEDLDLEDALDTDFQVNLSGSIHFLASAFEPGQYELRGRGDAFVRIYLWAERIR